MRYPEEPQWPAPPSPHLYAQAWHNLQRKAEADVADVQTIDQLVHFIGRTNLYLVMVGLHNPHGVRYLTTEGNSRTLIADKTARDMDFYNVSVLADERAFVVGFDQVNLGADIQRFSEVTTGSASLSLVNELSLFMPSVPLEQFVTYTDLMDVKYKSNSQDRLRASRPMQGEMGTHYLPLSDTAEQAIAVQGFAGVYQEIIQTIVEVAPSDLRS